MKKNPNDFEPFFVGVPHEKKPFIVPKYNVHDLHMVYNCASHAAVIALVKSIRYKPVQDRPHQWVAIICAVHNELAKQGLWDQGKIDLLSQYFGAIWDWFFVKRGETRYACDVYWDQTDYTCNAITQGFSGYGGEDDIFIDTINDIHDFGEDLGDSRDEFIALCIDCWGNETWEKCFSPSEEEE